MLIVRNQSGFTRRNPLIFLDPTFDAFYDKETGILIKMVECEPLLLKFFNIYLVMEFGVIMENKRFFGMALDSIGVEPVSNTVHGDHSSSTPPNILVPSIKVPSQIEVGKEFELSVIILNNGTTTVEGLRVLLSCTNGSIKMLSPEEASVGSMQPGEAKDVKWRLLLQSGGECSLRCHILKDDVKLLEKDLVIEGKPSLFQRVELFIIIFLILTFILVTTISLKRRSKKSYARFKYGEI